MKEKQIKKKHIRVIDSHDGVTAYAINKLQWVNNLAGIRKELKKNKQFKRAKEKSEKEKPKLSFIEELKEELSKSNE